MATIQIKSTQNPAIVKFEFDHFITKNKNYEYKNIDEAKNSALAKQLFYLPFVKTVYIASNFIAIEKFSIVEWEDVQEEVAEQIKKFIQDGGVVVDEDTTDTKKIPVVIYTETTPNPKVMKFVSNKTLTPKTVEFKNIDDTTASPIAKALFEFPFTKEVFIDENYISVTKYDSFEWGTIANEVRMFIKQFIENGGEVIDASLLTDSSQAVEKVQQNFENLDTTSQQIINIIEEYIKPAVQSDGGNIVFESFDPTTKIVKVILQGACSGCPSSTFTLKNGIENMLKQMLNDEQLIVEALNG